MSRSGYVDGDGDSEDMLRMYGWQANVRRCIGGRHGQSFMWELYLALDSLPKRELIQGGLMDQSGSCCSLGAVARHRGMEPPKEFCITDEGEPDDYEFEAAMGPLFGIKGMLAREVMWQNDDNDDSHEVPGPVKGWYGGSPRRTDSPHERWQRVRVWVVEHLRGIP